MREGIAYDRLGKPTNFKLHFPTFAVLKATLSEVFADRQVSTSNSFLHPIQSFHSSLQQKEISVIKSQTKGTPVQNDQHVLNLWKDVHNQTIHLLVFFEGEGMSSAVSWSPFPSPPLTFVVSGVLLEKNITIIKQTIPRHATMDRGEAGLFHNIMHTTKYPQTDTCTRTCTQSTHWRVHWPRWLTTASRRLHIRAKIDRSAWSMWSR